MAHKKWLTFLGTFTLTIIFFTAVNDAATAQSISGNTAGKLSISSKKNTINFYWQGDSINGIWEAHTAMLIPVKLKNCPKQFFMQFDLGSPYSLFYKNKLRSIKLKYPKAVPLNDTAGSLVNFSFKADKTAVAATAIKVKQFDSTAVNWVNKNSMEIIGTLGVDFIDGRVIVIDYPNKKILLSTDTAVTLLPKVLLSDFIYVNKSILLPAKVQDKNTLLYFDTGSSMFELLTDKKTCEAMALPGSKVIQRNIKSWDKYVTANSIASNSTIEINSIKIPIHFTTYIEGVNNNQAAQMMKMGIGGMTGNKIFLHSKLLLDTKNKKMGLITSE
jgi:hypothetical protein